MADEKPPDDNPLPRTERPDAPLYLARYHQRRSQPTSDDTADGSLPLYLRRFRDRQQEPTAPSAAPWEGRDLPFGQALAESSRNKEISAPPGTRLPVQNDVYLVRHGETQGYSTEAGLTPLGTWQAHTWGHELSKRLHNGETIVPVSADTNRARETVENMSRGLLDGLEMFGKDVEVLPPEPMEEFRNIQVATPDGLKDPTSAFRQYHTVLERYERVALGDRPMWLVEVDRFWRTQQAGGDPIQHWLTVPMLHFEPPVLCVRRFWRGLGLLVERHPGARIVMSGHSGPIRAFAIWALGYDPGEPYNTEHVWVKVLEGAKEAWVSYRNRVQEVHIPPVEQFPEWELEQRPARSAHESTELPRGVGSRESE